MNWADSHVEEGGSLVMDWDRLHGAFLSDANDDANDDEKVTATRIGTPLPTLETSGGTTHAEQPV